MLRIRLASAALGACLLLSACSAAASTPLPPSSPSTQTPALRTPEAVRPAAASTTSAKTRVPLTATPSDHREAGTRTAAAVLATLPVRGRAPMTGYNRAQFGQAWTDANDDLLGRNGCDTRNDILGRDLTDTTFRNGTGNCVVLTGRLADPYTAGNLQFTRGAATSAAIQIDHVVPLGDAWQTGAQNLPAALRVDLANDPLELLAVDGPTNDAKGDGDAATWLPPNKAYRCTYVARQVAVKARYHLWITAAEHKAMASVLARCPTEEAPAENKALPAVVAAAAPTAQRSTSTRPAPDPQAVVVPPTTSGPASATTRANVTAPGATALCNDGSLSFSKNHRGTCSHHGGVTRFYR